ncbi:hypothetical protein [Baaleninema simplex]|uniref:hypothetical protein n=1 Tax=Baaleninema simplex TaxID=2862350 RepID=UPI00034D833F|nr:hypothetical protein [Baaleninema simplex]
MTSIRAISQALTSMAQLEARFDLAAAQSDRFFPEWYEDLPSLTAEERASLDKIRHRWMRHRDSLLLLNSCSLF